MSVAPPLALRRLLNECIKPQATRSIATDFEKKLKGDAQASHTVAEYSSALFAMLRSEGYLDEAALYAPFHLLSKEAVIRWKQGRGAVK